MAARGPVAEVRVGGVVYVLQLTELHDLRQYRLLTSGHLYEPENVALLEDNLQYGDTFVDIGANNGYFSLLGARLVGPSGHVLAFEPNPGAFARLERNAAINGFNNIVAHQLALSDRAGEVEFYLGHGEDGLTSLISMPGDMITVRTDKLEELLHEPPDVLKIDAEGSELGILRGMESIFARGPHVRLLVEWNRKYASSPLFDFLRARFDVFRVDNRGKRGYILTEADSEADLPGLCSIWCAAKSS